MSIDYDLYRVPLEPILDEMNQPMPFGIPFGSQKEIIDRLCSVLGFERNANKKDEWLTSEHSPRATILYKYHHISARGRVIRYQICDEPVISISINRAFPEDLLPVIDVLSNLAPFVIVSSVDGVTNPQELFYSFDDWVQKNYQEDEDALQSSYKE